MTWLADAHRRRASGMRLLLLVGLMLAVAAGCRRGDDGPAPNSSGTGAASSGASPQAPSGAAPSGDSATGASDSASSAPAGGGAAVADSIAAAEDGWRRIGPLAAFTAPDQNGVPFGNRELHGRFTVMRLVPTAVNPPIEAEVQARFAAIREAADLSPYASWLQFVTVCGSAEAAKSVRPPAPDEAGFVVEAQEDVMLGLWRSIQAESSQPLTSVGPSGMWLIDPVGRVHAHPEEPGQSEGIEGALDVLYREQNPWVAEIFQPAWLPLREQAQKDSAAQIGAFHDFQFSDRSRESGIRFVHQIVDDAGRDYKGVHYDHGNGLPIADVDGDGRLDIYFVNQLGPNALYRNLGDGRFEDITAAAGVAVGDRICVSASFVDIDNDGDPDLYVTSVRQGNLLFRNEGGGSFKDVTAESGLGYQGHSGAAVFFDYDRDGQLDLLLCNVGKYTTDEVGRGGYFVGFKDAFSGHLKEERTELSRLYRNSDGLKFTDVTSDTGLEDKGWCGDAVVLDGNRDGWPDVYTLNMQGDDEYYENDQGRRFVRRSRELFPKTPWGSMGGALLDVDGDGDQDLYVTDMHSDMTKNIEADPRSEISLNTFYAEEKLKALTQHPESLLKTEGRSLFGNAVFRNDGPGQFAEVSDQIGAENYWPWGLSVADLNADGFEDAFVTSSMNYPYRYAVNSLLLNDGGARFADAEFILGVEPRRGGRTAQPWFLLDCSGEQDELIKKVCTGRQGECVVWGALGTRSAAMFDLDSDGDLDIVTSEFNDAPLVLLSNLAEQRTVRRLEIELQGVQSNRQGIGAQVEVVAGDRRLVQAHDGRTGYLSQSAAPLYFGLGDAEAAERIVVTWPNGTVEDFAGPFASGTRVQLKEAAAIAPAAQEPPEQ